MSIMAATLGLDSAETDLLRLEGATEALFRHKIGPAVEKIKSVLDVQRNPSLANEVPHTYADKFSMAERAVETMAETMLTTLSQLGLSARDIEKVADAAKTRRIYFFFRAQHLCKQLRQESREVITGNRTEIVTEKSIFGGTTKKETTIQAVKTVEETIWELETNWRLGVRTWRGWGWGWAGEEKNGLATWFC